MLLSQRRVLTCRRGTLRPVRAPTTCDGGDRARATGVGPTMAATAAAAAAARRLTPASSARPQCTRTLASPAASTAASANLHRFWSESSKVTSQSGRAMARMMPGSPAPDPTSISLGPAATPAAASCGCGVPGRWLLLLGRLPPRSHCCSCDAGCCGCCCGGGGGGGGGCGWVGGCRCCDCCWAARQRSSAGSSARLSFTCRS